MAKNMFSIAVVALFAVPLLLQGDALAQDGRPPHDRPGMERDFQRPDRPDGAYKGRPEGRIEQKGPHDGRRPDLNHDRDFKNRPHGDDKNRPDNDRFRKDGRRHDRKGRTHK